MTFCAKCPPCSGNNYKDPRWHIWRAVIYIIFYIHLGQICSLWWANFIFFSEVLYIHSPSCFRQRSNPDQSLILIKVTVLSIWWLHLKTLRLMSDKISSAVVAVVHNTITIIKLCLFNSLFWLKQHDMNFTFWSNSGERKLIVWVSLRGCQIQVLRLIVRVRLLRPDLVLDYDWYLTIWAWDWRTLPHATITWTGSSSLNDPVYRWRVDEKLAGRKLKP